MRRRMGIFLVALVMSFLVNAQSAWAGFWGYMHVPELLELRLDDVKIEENQAVQIEVNETLFFDVYVADFNNDGRRDWDDTTSHMISTDTGVMPGTVVGIMNAVQLNGMANLYFTPLKHDSYEEPIGRLSVTTSGVVDGVLQVQLTYDNAGVEGGIKYSNEFRFRLQTGPVSDLHYLYVPKGMKFIDENYNTVTSIRMEASRTRQLYVTPDDYNGDGRIDASDYDVYPVNNLVMQPTVSQSGLITGVSTNPELTGLTPSDYTYPRRIAKVTLSAINQATTEDAYTTAYYQITFGGTTGSGIPVQNILPDSGVIRTPEISILVYPRDDAGDGDDSGGTCSSLGMGVLLLGAPLLWGLKRKR